MRNKYLQYSFETAVAVIISASIRAFADALLHEKIPYTPFYPAIILIAYYRGLAYGALATALSAFAAAFWITPEWRPAITEATDLAGMILFLLTCGLITWLADRARHAREVAEEAADERQRLLQREQSAREEAERANRAKDEFLASVSHELRTPLQSILGWAELLEQGGLDESEVRLAHQAIERGARVQGQLVNDLLDMGRIISGKLWIESQPVLLAECVEAAISTVSPAARAKGVALSASLDRTAGVLGDRKRLQQILWNLLSNAIKFTPTGGRIDVVLSVRENDVVVQVRDTGQGIEASLLPQLFKRFRQADDSVRQGGLGLGLAIVKQLVELHGGAARAESAGKGCGATIEIVLPRLRVAAIHHDPVPGVNSKESAASRALAGLKVLVVDDDDEACRVIRQVLEQNEAEVRTATSAQDALRVLESEQPDVVLSDLAMPGEDGCQLIKRLRREGSGLRRSVPAAALTAYTGAEDRQRVLRSGFQEHLCKPIATSELVTTIARLAQPHF